IRPTHMGQFVSDRVGETKVRLDALAQVRDNQCGRKSERGVANRGARSAPLWSCTDVACGGWALVEEVPDTGKDHGDSGFVRGGDPLFVALCPTRLRDSRDACCGSSLDTIGEGEERVAGEDTPFRAHAGSLHRDTDGVDPVGLTSADADRGLALCEDDGVRLDMPDGAPGEGERGDLLWRRLAARDGLPGRGIRLPAGGRRYQQ